MDYGPFQGKNNLVHNLLYSTQSVSYNLHDCFSMRVSYSLLLKNGLSLRTEGGADT